MRHLFLQTHQLFMEWTHLSANASFYSDFPQYAIKFPIIDQCDFF